MLSSTLRRYVSLVFAKRAVYGRYARSLAGTASPTLQSNAGARVALCSRFDDETVTNLLVSPSQLTQEAVARGKRYRPHRVTKEI
jgi:hypothetical protein